jgi:hypothetical protein
MSARLRNLLVLVAAVGLALGALWFVYRFAGRPPEEAQPPLPFQQGGVRVSLVPTTGVGGPTVSEATTGDWLFESDRVRLVVGGDGDGVERRFRYGSIVDLVTRDFADEKLVEFRPVLQVGGKLVGTRVDGVRLETGGPRPVLRLLQASRDGAISLETELRLVPGQPFVELVTHAKNLGGTLARSVQVGERARWRGPASFAPRLGFVRAAMHAEVPWVSSTGGGLTYALAFPEGMADATFLFDRFGSSGQVTLSRVDDLPPGDELVYRRRLLVVEGGLEHAAELAWRMVGKELGIVTGSIGAGVRWGSVEARYPDGRTALTAHIERDGHYWLPLPTGDYTLLLRVPGGEDDAAVHVEAGAQVTSGLLAPRAGTLRYAITDEEGGALPARLVVTGIAPTKDPEFGPIELAVGAKNVAYTRDGQGFLELPPGRYKVLATHGTEYSIASQDLEVNPDVGVTFRASLAHEVDTTGYLACDFHLHQAPSFDSTVSLEDRVLTLLSEGIEFAVPTDHNHVTDFTETIAALDAERALGTASGVEITTQSWGHFNAFPYPPSAPVPPFALDPPEIFASVRAHAPEAVLQVNHPRMPGVGYFNRGELDSRTGVAESEGFSFDFDTLEVVNGFDLENPKLIDDDMHEWFELINAGRRYTAVGNSDSHRLVYQWAGYPRTYVRVADDRPSAVTAGEVARALVTGHAVVSNGIFILALVNGKAEPGDLVSGGRVTLQVSVRAPDWVDVRSIEVYANGVLAVTHPVTPGTNPLRAQWEHDLEFANDTFLVVVAKGDTAMRDTLPGKWIRPFGFTNPIYVDANRDGVFRSVGPGIGPVAAPPASASP